MASRACRGSLAIARGAFVLHPLDARHTRLIERWRLDFPRTLRMQLFWGLVECVDFVMQRTQLRHIKLLAERAAA